MRALGLPPDEYYELPERVRRFVETAEAKYLERTAPFQSG